MTLVNKMSRWSHKISIYNSPDSGLVGYLRLLFLAAFNKHISHKESRWVLVDIIEIK